VRPKNSYPRITPSSHSPRDFVSPSSTLVFTGLLVMITCGGDTRLWLVDIGHIEAREGHCNREYELSTIILFLLETPFLGHVTIYTVSEKDCTLFYFFF
jgi:hypothetical protein